MQQKRMGRTGLRVSEICLGTMTFGIQADQAAAFAIMDTAERHGITFFDTSDVYPLGAAPGQQGATETIVGNWLHERGARERIVLATKARGAMGPGPNQGGLSRKHLIEACEASLRRLRTDYIDLYQCHHPDDETPIDETMRAMDDLVRDGKVRYLGCSNYPAWQIARALWTSDKHNLARFDCAQPRYNILYRMIEQEILPLCRAEGIGVIAYNPLAAGMLTGRYRQGRALEANSRFTLERAGARYRARYWNDAAHEAVDSLGGYFDERGISLTHAALAWVLGQPGITSAIVGASRAEQLDDSLARLDLKLDADALARCNAVWFDLPRESDPEVMAR